MKIIKIYNDKCLSVQCDFYQTCIKNTVSHTYQTKKKFIPIVLNSVECFSFDSGKQNNLRDNNYPHKFVSMHNYNLYPAKDVVEFV